MMWFVGLAHVVLSIGYITAIIPILIILILIVAAAGLSRGWSLFSLFGLGTLAGIGLGSRGSVAKRTAYDSKSKGAEQEGWKSNDKNPSLIAGGWSTFKQITGRYPSKMTVGENSPNVVNNKTQGRSGKTMTQNEMNNYIAGKVRMAVVNAPTNYRSRRTSVPEQPFEKGMATNVPAFSSAENAIAWSLAGTMGAFVTTPKMRKLASENPKAFDKKYKRAARRLIYRQGFNDAAVKIGSSLRTNGAYRRKLSYAMPIGKEWGKGELHKFKLKKGKYKLTFKSRFGTYEKEWGRKD